VAEGTEELLHVGWGRLEDRDLVRELVDRLRLFVPPQRLLERSLALKRVKTPIPAPNRGCRIWVSDLRESWLRLIDPAKNCIAARVKLAVGNAAV
jgi:hypothetical protein